MLISFGKIKNCNLFTAAFIASCLALCVVWGYQIFAKVMPCHLCLLERLPLYAYLGAFAIYSLVKRFFNKKWLDFCLATIGSLLFVSGACLAFYHILVVLEVVSSSCGLSLEDITSTINQTAPSLASCTDTSFAILGLPAVYLCFAFFTLLSLCFCICATTFATNLYKK